MRQPEQQCNIPTIVKRIMTGELTRDNDESWAGGFWDLSGDISYSGIGYKQELLYNVLWELYEELDKERQKNKKTIDDIKKIVNELNYKIIQ